MDWWFWPLMFLGVVIHFSKRSMKNVTPEQKEQAAHGFVDFLSRRFR